MYTKKIEKANHRYLVFTSAGNNNNVLKWCKNKNFDLFIAFYGSYASSKLISSADYFVEIKGGKFPNVKKCFDLDRAVFEQYSAILVTDDDIHISGPQINELFKMREQHSFDILQPSFDPAGKISHEITTMHLGSDFRVTNFVEVTCPMFKAEPLFKFLEQYDPILVGWGVDYWFCNYLNKQGHSKIGIVDKITCLNPHDITKTNGREIERLQVGAERARIWSSIIEKYNLEIDRSHIIYKNKIASSPLTLVYQMYITARFQTVRVLRKLKIMKI